MVNLNEVSFEYQATPKIMDGGEYGAGSSDQDSHKVQLSSRTNNDKGSGTSQSMTRRQDLRIDCYEDEEGNEKNRSKSRSKSRQKKL
jgi:hypothetical protein